MIVLFACVLLLLPLVGAAYYLKKMSECGTRIEEIKWDASKRFYSGLNIGEEEEIAALKKAQWKYCGASFALMALFTLLFLWMLFPYW